MTYWSSIQMKMWKPCSNIPPAMRELFRRLLAIGILLFLAAPQLIAQTSSFAYSEESTWGGGEDFKLFDEGKRLRNEQKWREAIAVFQKLRQQFPQSVYADDAQFWIAYCFKKQGDKTEEAFRNYEKLVQEHPQSSWVDDAEAEMVELARDLVAQGKSEYRRYVDTALEKESRMARLQALLALGDLKDRKAIPLLVDILNKEKDAAIRLRAMMMLEEFEAPEAMPAVLQTLKTEENKDIKLRALYYLENVYDERALAVLLELLRTEKDPDLRLRTLYVLEEMSSSAAAPALLEVLQNDADPNLRLRALYALEELNDERVVPALLNVLSKKRREPRPQVARIVHAGRNRRSARHPGIAASAQNRNRRQSQTTRALRFGKAQGLRRRTRSACRLVGSVA